MNATPNESARPGANQDGRELMTNREQTTMSAVGLQDKITVEEHHRWITEQADRRECLAIVERVMGATKHFLDCPQPALGDRTGRELLEQEPAELLRRLRQLEEGR